MRAFLLSMLLHLLAGTLMVGAQNAGPPPDITVDAAARVAVIEGAIKVLNAQYVFPDVAKKMEDAIRARQQRKEYDSITSGRQLAQLLTDHLRDVSHDLHLGVHFFAQPPPPPGPPPGSAGSGQTVLERQRAMAGRRNFGFARVERLTSHDVYILTSAKTFSGAEEFTYNLKHLKRATVVGETTGGGAHTVAGEFINAHFGIAVPNGRPINPITKTNWEGVGVEPDVKVSADNALKAAHLIALEKQLEMLGPDAPGFKDEITTAIESLRKELGPAAAAIATAEVSHPVPASTANEDFESGTLANWRVDQRGGRWVTYTDGKKAPDPAASDANMPFDVPNPPQGKFAAIVESNGPGRRILFRDVTLDGRYRLHLTVFYVNNGTFSAATVSSRNRITDEQQYRIDVVSASAPVDSVAPHHVLATIFQGRPGDPSRRQPADISVDLSQWAGHTIRLRFAAADNQGPMRAGVDNIRFERLGQ